MNFTALLLAGGRSRRMGRDKATLSIDGAPLWRRQLDLLVASGAEEILISGRPDAPYAGCGYEVISDELPELGPLSGIKSGLAAARHGALLVLAIDLPSMTAEFLRGALRLAADSRQGVVHHDGTRFQPLAAIYTRPCLPWAAECLAGSDRSMQHFVRGAVERQFVTALPLAPKDAPLFQNLNTPRDLKRQ